MDVINSGMRKAIKIMVVTCQTAQFVSLMPKPKDFVTRIVGDVVYLSSQVQKLSDDINRLLDQYADIPVNYLMTQVNSITGSLTGITNRLNTFTQNAVNQTFGFGENTLNNITELTGGIIDTVGETTKAVESIGMTIAHTSSSILGQLDVASEIHDATEIILEWTSDGFKNISKSATEPINEVTKKIVDLKTGTMNTVNNTATEITNTIGNSQKWIETLLENIREKMNILSAKLDCGFKDVTGINSISKGTSFITDALRESDNNSSITQVTSAISTSLTDVLNNFSISKVITAFAGVLTQSVIVKTGLNQLPPIDFESMLNQIRSDMIITNEDLFNELNSMIDDMDEFTSSIQKADERNYDDKKYKEYIKQFDDEIKKQRDDIMVSMKYNKPLTNKQKSKKEIDERLAMKSAIKEVRKFRKQIKNAKQTSKLSNIISDELDNLKNEVNYRCNSIKSDWSDMMDQYKNAIKEIRGFFQNGGDGDKFIDDCCDAINNDCNSIKELCSNIGTQLIGCTLKVVMPADLGPVFPNPIYKLSSFWMDVKTIIKFIKDLITYIIDIINNINKLARIMLNGLNNLQEIINQLMDLIGIKWFMDLIQSIIDFFGTKIKDVKMLLENSLSPVYYKDTEEYNNILETLETLSENSDNNGNVKISTSDDKYISLTNKEHYFHIEVNDTYFSDVPKTITSFTTLKMKVEDCINEIEKREDDIVAYKSPILEYTDEEPNVMDISKGNGNLNVDIKFIGWIFFHPDLGHTTYYGDDLIGKLMKKIKSKIIQKAAKTSNKENGGINGLKTRWKVKKDSGYKAFFWYKYYTEDLEKDCFESSMKQGYIKIDSIIQAQNGSIIEINGKKVFVKDNNVRHGDFVVVDGIRYRV